jgi:hypothetical protein
LCSSPRTSGRFKTGGSTIAADKCPLRLNADLGEFVSTIYSKAFTPQKTQLRQLATRLQSLSQPIECNPDKVMEDVREFLLALSAVMLRRPQSLLRPPLRKEISGRNPSGPLAVSLALLNLQTHASNPDKVGYEIHVRGEAAVAAALVCQIQRCSPDDDIFVATPHRIQRQAVKAAIESMRASEDALIAAIEDMWISTNRHAHGSPKVVVDTVERLQGAIISAPGSCDTDVKHAIGSEAAFVICLFSLPSNSRSSTGDLDFLLERRRLNVAISRAKVLCILISSDAVLRPPVTVLANEGSARGFAFLKDYQDRAWSGTVDVDLDQFYQS